MPCFCEYSDEEMDEVKSKIKVHAQEICRLIKESVHYTNRYPDLLRDTLKLIEHMYTGKCDEKGL